jgi:hypothetical protein
LLIVHLIDLKDKTDKALNSQPSHIRVAEQRTTPEFELVAEHAPNVERMMRGVMVACGVSRNEIERLLKERREQMKFSQRVAS